MLYCGAENVYIRDPQKVMDVIGEVQPTVMCAVPRLYEKAYAMIQARVAQAPRLRQALFGWATKVGKQMVATRQAGKTASPLLYGQLWLAERLVFRKLRARFGTVPASCRWPAPASPTRLTSSSRPWGSTSSTATA